MKLHILLALVSLTILVASIPVGLVANTLPTSNITNDVRSRGVQVFVPGATMPASNSTSPSILKLQPRKKKGPGAIRREKVKWLCFEASLQEFLAARKLRQPQGVDWHADGCSNKPDHLIPWNCKCGPISFPLVHRFEHPLTQLLLVKSSCQRHDFCLQNLLVDQVRFESRLCR